MLTKGHGKNFQYILSSPGSKSEKPAYSMIPNIYIMEQTIENEKSVVARESRLARHGDMRWEQNE